MNVAHRHANTLFTFRPLILVFISRRKELSSSFLLTLFHVSQTACPLSFSLSLYVSLYCRFSFLYLAMSTPGPCVTLPWNGPITGLHLSHCSHLEVISGFLILSADLFLTVDNTSDAGVEHGGKRGRGGRLTGASLSCVLSFRCTDLWPP